MDSNKKSSRGRQPEKGKTKKKTTFKSSDNKSKFSIDKKPKSFRKPFEKEKNGKFQKYSSKNDENSTPKQASQKNNSDGIRLNKYIANAGICSRREADIFIKAGSATVNGKLVTEMGYRVQELDEVRFDGVLLNQEIKRYVLLNKPKNFITTMEDERGRKTVMELIANATKERIYPVGRLDRNTTGLLLFTNDGEIAKKLTHPKNAVQKLYHASLDKKLSAGDMQKISEGFTLDDKRVQVDAIDYILNQPKTEIGIKIHSGRNRIVRKIFEHFNYEVVKLDRVVFAGLTKKDLPRGQWRHLTEMEVNNLKML